jgi:hypothetical protein
MFATNSSMSNCMRLDAAGNDAKNIDSADEPIRDQNSFALEIM